VSMEWVSFEDGVGPANHESRPVICTTGPGAGSSERFCPAPAQLDGFIIMEPDGARRERLALAKRVPHESTRPRQIFSLCAPETPRPRHGRPRAWLSLSSSAGRGLPGRSVKARGSTPAPNLSRSRRFRTTTRADGRASEVLRESRGGLEIISPAAIPTGRPQTRQRRGLAVSGFDHQQCGLERFNAAATEGPPR